MSELFSQLGIDWKLLLSQGVNFFILLAALTVLMYRPVIKLMEERRRRIEFGLQGADEAEERLKNIEKIKSEKMAEADKEAVSIIGSAEKRGEDRFRDIVAGAEKKAEDVVREAAHVVSQKKKEEFDAVAKEAKALIKEAIVKTVELDPSQVDDKLIGSAVENIKGKAL
jgi:F-type H+-transporting ATPase subunit b